MSSCRLAFASLLLAAATLVRAAEPAGTTPLALPAPRTDGTVAVEKALAERRSLRTPAPAPLTVAEIGQLCWAAQGVTDAKGHRTAPSARAKYPLELYVLVGNVEGLAPGRYHYLPATHALELRAPGDPRAAFEAKAIGQGWSDKAPAVFVIAGVAGRMASMKERGAPFMWVEAGLAAENFFLQATALGLGSTYVGGFDPAAARSGLELPAEEEVLAVLPVGHKP
jgi:SagB-type dehydrogenase family enzyme